MTWVRAKVREMREATCKFCEAAFVFYPKGQKGVYCSRACKNADMKGDPASFDRTGTEPWNKGKTGVYSADVRRRMGRKNIGRAHTEEFKAKMSLRVRGNKYAAGGGWTQTAESNTKRRVAHLGKPKYKNRGARSPLWKGGVNAINKAARQAFMETLEYKNWRRAVLKRDGKKCQAVGCSCTKRLHVHHIKSYQDFPDLRLVVSNGVTLCEECHWNIRNTVFAIPPGDATELVGG